MQSAMRSFLKIVLAVMAVAGCAFDGTDKASSPKKTITLPKITPPERPSDRDHNQLVAGFGGEYRSNAPEALLNDILKRLAPATERPDEIYRPTILNSGVINAFALPSGRIYVTRGTLELANDTSELAAVLAHEISHVTLRHAAARGELELRSSLVSRVVTDVLKDPEAGDLVKNRSIFSIASFSRAQELEADAMAVRILSRAGYDPYGAVRFLQSLDRWSRMRVELAGDKTSDNMLSTHPNTSERIALTLQNARQIGGPGLGEQDRARYMAAIEGLVSGDNAQNGATKGRVFAHPRFNIVMTAPSGFVLNNTPQALLGISNKGMRRMVFDVFEGNDQNLENALKSAWNDKIALENIQSAQVNGLSATLAQGAGKDYIFRMAALTDGTRVFRLILATKPQDQEAERLFSETLQSIRPLSGDEARRLVQPLKLKIITAQKGETQQDLAARMSVQEQALTRFQILNGLASDSVVTAGERYKIVEE